MAKRSMLQVDETYQQVQDEIYENANTVDFVETTDTQETENKIQGFIAED